MGIHGISKSDAMRHRAEQDGYKALALNDWKRAKDCFEKVGNHPSTVLRITKVCAELDALSLAKTVAVRGYLSSMDSEDFESRESCFQISVIHYCLFCFGKGLELVTKAPDWEKLPFEVTWPTSNGHSATYGQLFAEFSRLIRCFKEKTRDGGAGPGMNVLLQHCDSLRVVFLRPMSYSDVFTAVNGLNNAAKNLQSMARSRGPSLTLEVAGKMKVAATKLTHERLSFVSKYMMKD